MSAKAIPSTEQSTHRRFLVLRAEDIKDDTIQVAFSSETPGQQRAGEAEELLGICKRGQLYTEILSHEPDHVDLTQLNNTGAFLDEHENMRQIGNVKKAALSEDKVCRAVLEFDGASKLSKTRKAQMTKRSRPHISFGYRHTKYIGTRDMGEGKVGHVFAWAGREISSVADPMDGTVGVGRSKSDYHCLGCASIFSRSDLNEDFYCQTCADAMEPAEEDESGKRKAESERQRLALEIKQRADQVAEAKKRAADRDLSGIQFKRSDTECISLENLRQLVSEAAGMDERFCKDCNGRFCSYFWVKDILIEEAGVEGGEDVDNLFAIISGADCNCYKVAFTYDGTTVKLGTAVKVEAQVEYVEVEAEEAARSGAPAVDSRALESGKTRNAILTQTPKVMTDTIAPEVEKNIRSDAEAKTRAAIIDEQKQRNSKIEARNTELAALTDEFVRDHGLRIGGKSGEKFHLGEKFRAIQIELQAKDDSVSAAEARLQFRQRAQNLIENSSAPKNPINAAELDKELSGRCSLLAGIANCVRNKSSVPKDGAEREAHDEIIKRANEFPGGIHTSEGFHFPSNAPTPAYHARMGSDGRIHRDMLATNFASGGALVAPQMVLPIIELLRNMVVLEKVGITSMGGLMGNVLIPRQEAATTGQSVAEAAQLAAYDQVLGQIRMEPKRIGSTQNYSRLLLLQSSPDVEAFIRDDHFKVLAILEDALGITGSGAAGQPVGILNAVGIASVLFGGAATYAKIVSMETAIRKQNVYDPISFISTSTARGVLRVAPETLTGSTVVSGSTAAIWKATGGDNETVLGRPAFDTQQVPGDKLIAGAFRHLIKGQWGGLNVVVDNLTRADRDEIKITINNYIDYVMRHAQAFCVSGDSAAQ